MPEQHDESYRKLIEATKNAFKEKFKTNCEGIATAPGRINIIGEHVDYTGGFSIPAGINRWTAVAFSKRLEDPNIVIHSLDFDDEMVIDLELLGRKKTPDISWRKFALGAVALFHRNVGLKGGLNILIHGNLPMSKGISSSSSVEMAILNALRDVNQSDISDTDLCLLAQQIEHIYLGVESGLLDQFAIQFAQQDHLQLIDFKRMDHEYIVTHPIFNKYCWALVDSQIKRELTDSGYQKRVEECHQGLQILKQVESNVKSFRDITEAILIRHLKDKHPVLYKRLLHMVEENDRTLKAKKALLNGDTATLGILLNESHFSLQTLYEVSIEELDKIQYMGIHAPGCAGGRLMGGGFGGCCLFLIETDQTKAFCKYMEKAFRDEFNKESPPLILDMVWGARVVTCK